MLRQRGVPHFPEGRVRDHEYVGILKLCLPFPQIPAHAEGHVGHHAQQDDGRFRRTDRVFPETEREADGDEQGEQGELVKEEELLLPVFQHLSVEDRLRTLPGDPFTDAAEAPLLLVHAPDHFPGFLAFLQFRIIIGEFRRFLIVAAVTFHTDRRDNRNAHHRQIKDRTDHIQDGRAEQDQPVGRDLPAHDRDHLKRRQIHQRPGALNGKAVYPEVKHHRQRERRHKDLDRPADPFHHALRQPVIGVQEQHDRDLEGQLDDQSEQDHQDCLHRMDPEHGKRPDPDHKPDAHGSHIVHPGALKQHQLRADRRREYKVRVGRPEENPLPGRIGHKIA